MDLAIVKQEQGETLRKYMRYFFDKRATVVDVTDKEVIDLFQDGLYHRRTFKDFSRRRPSSITKLKDMITSWDDEEYKANAKYDAIRGKSKKNPGGSNNNNRDQRARNNNSYSGPNRKRKPDNTVAAIQHLAKDNSKKTSGGFKDLLKEKCPWHLLCAITPPSSVTNFGEQSRLPQTHGLLMIRRARKSRQGQRRLPRTRQDGECPLRQSTHQAVSEGH
jgi:hypothetical protein